jgi:hypothetical protein
MVGICFMVYFLSITSARSRSGRILGWAMVVNVVRRIRRGRRVFMGIYFKLMKLLIPLK